MTRVGPGPGPDYRDCHAQLGTGNSKLGKPLTVGLGRANWSIGLACCCCPLSVAVHFNLCYY